MEGPGCPSGYDAGLTNQTSLVPVTTEFFLISNDSNHVPKWLGLLSGGPIITLVK